MERCPWAKGQLDIIYHDTEWGIPVYNDNKLFEFVILESAQCGLSWSTILKKRSHYKEAYDGYDPYLVATYDHERQTSLLQNPGIIRNRLKISSSVENAKAFIGIQNKYNSFSDYLWNFTDGKIIENNWKTLKEIPASSPLSDKISKDLKSHGFKFFGPTTTYAFLQAVGVINDHLVSCFRNKDTLL